jgi:hypothetical protein
MANFTAGTSFSDGVTNDVTALKLNALVADAVPTSNLALTSTNGTIANFTSSTANITLGTIPTLTAGTTTGTAGIFTSGTIATLNSTTGTIPTLVATTLITTGAGTVAAPAIAPTGDTNTGIFFPAADTIAFSEGGAEAMRIDSSGFTTLGGNGISATPSGTLNISDSNDSTARLWRSSAEYIQLAAARGGTTGQNNIFLLDIVGNPNIRSFKIRQSSNGGSSFTDSVVLDPSGNVIIGTSTAWGVGKTTIESSDLPLGLRAGSDNTALVIGKATNNSTTSQVLLQFLHNNYSDGIGQINANGANAAAFGSYSDSRLKENITELPSQLANICLLKPSEFDYKNGSGHQVGFIAQEIQQIYPDVVGEGDGGMLTVTGWSKTEARLVKAIQELKSENDSLKSRIEALEAK